MKKLYVGNMSFETTESELRSLFEPFGEIGSIHVATDRATGRARGFAFVEMPDDESARKAMAALDGNVVAGRALKVNEARPKPQDSGGGQHRGERGFGRQRRKSRW